MSQLFIDFLLKCITNNVNARRNYRFATFSGMPPIGDKMKLLGLTTSGFNELPVNYNSSYLIRNENFSTSVPDQLWTASFPNAFQRTIAVPHRMALTK